MMKRTYLIAGNWKMHKTAEEADALTAGILKALPDNGTEVLICPPFTAMSSVAETLQGSALHLGAQNLYPADAGAYTGEVSPSMLKALGASYVILGHSERRSLFGETDTFINKKVKAAIHSDIKPILCVGESLEDREAGNTLAIVGEQVRGGLKGISPENGGVVIAYEPIWAIGTGKTASPEMAQEVHAAIRSILSEVLGDTLAASTRILYGGSMKPGNAQELLAQPDIDGGLIGGASLDAEAFASIASSV